MERDLVTTLGAMARQQERHRRTQWIATAAVAAIAIVVGVIIGKGKVEPTPPTPQAAEDTAPPAPAPLAVEAKLMRRTGDLEIPLLPGGRISPGDRLSLLVQGSDSMHVYVLDEDGAGEVFALYPIPGLVPSNPLSGHVEHRLPGDLGGDVVYWNVTSAGGRESIIAIGSRHPLEDMEAVLADIPRARPGRPIRFGKVNPMALRTLRGLESGSSLEPPRGEARRRLRASLEAYEAQGRETGDIWVWSIDLANPPPAP
jgi:hypothetical protein